jgi:PKD repeat protein
LIQGGYITVTNPPPQLAISPTNSIDFGQLLVGQSSTQSVSIVNNGGLTLTGSVTAALPFAIQSGSPYTLAPGQTGTVSITFSPVTGGASSNVAVFLSNGGNRISSLIGAGLTPAQFLVSPAALDFGTVSAGSTIQANFILTNAGNLPITTGTAVVAGGPFALVSGSPFTIPGLGSTNVRVRFSPVKAGSFSNVVVFATENAGGSTNAVIGISTFAPVADFGAISTNGAKPLTVGFIDRSTGSITNWLWDFGDGFTSNSFGGNVSHTYTATGKYSVSLNVIGPLGSDSRTNINLVNVVDGLLITSIRPSGPDVQIKFYSRTGEFYRVEYTDTLSPPDWKPAADFVAGTGDIVTAIHPNGAGRPSRFYRVAQLSNADLLPVANFIASPLFGLTPLTVTFVDTSGGFVTNRFWDFGDGSTTNTTATTVSHTYTLAGSKTVTLTASGPLGDSVFTRPNYIFATDQLVITSIRTSGSDVVVSFTSRQGEFYRVDYTDTFTPALWKTAIAAVPGTGDIVTTIHTGGAGQRSRFYRVALLSGAELVPVADFIATPNFGQSPLKATFTDTSSGYSTNRFWDFGDGSTTNTTATTISHTYVSPGTNTVTLLVSGPFGDSARSRPNYIATIDYLLITSIRKSGSNMMIGFTSKAGEFYRLEYTDGLSSPVWKPAGDFVLGTGDIVTAIHLGGFSQSARFYRVHLSSVIEAVPSANFSANVTSGPPPLSVNFVDASAGYVTNRLWNFGDGSTTNTTLSTVSHIYGSVGSNTVTLTVTGPLGASTSTRTNFITVVGQIVISGIRLAGSDVILNFSSETGRSYRIEYTDNLLLPWNTAVDSVPGTGGVMAVTHINGGGAAARFYRIRQL